MADAGVENGSAPGSQFYVFPFYDRPATMVEDQMQFMTGIAQSAITTTKQEIALLANFQPPVEGTPPNLQPTPINPADAPVVALPNPQLFGMIDGINEPAFDDLQSIVDSLNPGDAPVFDPSVVSINIPAPPPPIDTSGLPDRPTINDVALPPDPDVVMPAEVTMLAIDIPDRPTIELPLFDAQMPTLEGDVPGVVLDWTEPTYVGTNLTELAATIKAMLAGDYGMPPAVQEALFYAAFDRETTVARGTVESAFDDFAGRGFGMPPGMLVEQVNVARQNSQLQANALSRDVLAKAAQWQIDNLRTAVSQGIALESALIEQHNQIAQRTLEAARLRVEQEFTRYNLRVTAFNAQLAQVNTLVVIFQAKVQAELSKIEVFKAEIEAEQLKGQINEQAVRIYTAKVQSLSLIVDMFKAKLDAVKSKVDIEQGKIEMYRADVQAYAERVGAGKAVFDAYTAQVQGEAAKAGILESESRAFAATVQAFAEGNNVKVAVVQARLRAIEVAVTKYSALLGAERERINAEVGAIQAQSAAYSADVGRYSAQFTFATQRNELLVRAQEGTVRNNMAYFDVLAKQYDSAQARLIEVARLNKEAIQTAGTMASQLAAGALSATHVQASLSGAGSASTSWSDSTSTSYSHTFDETQ